MKLNTLILLCFISSIVWSYGQRKEVAITIDDVPNTRLYQEQHFLSPLMQQLDRIEIPVALFVNEGFIYKSGDLQKNFVLFTEWFEKEYVTIGNHSFSHPRYSDVGLDSFSLDVIKGSYLSKELSKKLNKPFRYFRFPYNDMGKDSTQHLAIRKFMRENGYIITPFTVESSDWMFNRVYEHYLDLNNEEQAAAIAEQYVQTTLAFFDFFEELSLSLYGRPIKQIYLCHDNRINAKVLPQIINGLKEKNYDFITLDEALQDELYRQEDHYYQKWGVSWIYRWMNDPKQRMEYMRNEPSTQAIYKLFNSLPK